MDWISIIPMRAGSKGVKNKNTRPICGKPLYQYTIDFARKAGTRKIYITTDIQDILSSPAENGIIVSQRKSSLCQDDTTMSSVILDFLVYGAGKELSDDQTIVLLQVTSPLRQKSDLITALDQFSASHKINLMMAVTQAENNSLKYGFLVNGNFKHIAEPSLCFENRQNLPKLFKPTGAFYIFKAGWYRSNKGFATNATGAYEISTKQTIDIDSLEDIERLETILKN